MLRPQSFILLLLSVSSAMCFGEPLIVAHRGASAEAPENTLPAFELAWRQGADAIEGDFQLSRDGAVVCIHDDTTKKVADRNLVVSDATLAELRALDVGLHMGEAFKGTRIPTFEQVAATVPESKQLFIEIKCGPEILPVLLQKMKETGLSDEQMVVISFNRTVIEALKKQAPAYRAYWLHSFKKRNKQSAVEIIQSLRQMSADGLSSNNQIEDEVVKAVQQAGFEWHVWTIDEPTQAKRYCQMGAKSVTTNRPALLKQSLLIGR